VKHLPRMLTLIVLSLAVGATAVAQKPELVSQIGHLDLIYALAISHDAKLLASAGVDKSIIVWSIPEGKQISSLKGHSEWVFTLAFSPDGRLLASGSSDNTVILWNVSKGTKEVEISLQGSDVTCVAFSPDGNTLAISGEDKVIKLWDVPTRKMKADLLGHTKSVRRIAFSPDGNYLVSASLDETLRQWNLATLKTERQTKFEAKFTSLAYSLDGNLVAVGNTGEAVGFWDLRTGKLTTKSLPQGASLVDALTFISDKELALLNGSDLTLWNFETNEIRVASENSSGEGSKAVELSKDNKLLAFNDGRHIKLLDLKTNQIRELKGGLDSVSEVAFSSDGNFLAASVGNRLDTFGDQFGVGDQERGTMIANLLGIRFAFVPSVGVLVTFGEIDGGYGSPNIEFIQDFTKPETNRILKAHTKSINSIAVHPNGNLLASSSEDGTVKLWDVKKLWGVKKPWDIKNAKPSKVLQEHANKITFNHDGTLLATESKDSTIKLWDTKTWEYRIIPNKRMIRSLLFSPNGEVLAVAELSGRHHLTLWDTATYKPLHSWSLDFTPETFDTRFFGSNEQSVHVVFGEMAGSSKTFGSVSFSRDTSMVACVEINYAVGDYRIKIWSVKTGKVLHTLTGHSSSIRSTAFSPSGNVLASGSWDTTIKLWSTKMGEELATIAPRGKGNWVIYTPDGRFDTNIGLEDNDSLHWIMPGDALNPLPLDIFMRDYFEPKLFQRLMNCAESGSCDREFKKIRNLSELNRIRPEVKIMDVSFPDANRTVNVTVKVSRASGVFEREDRQQVTRSTGVYDLRLFRDDQLVGVVPADGAEKLARQNVGLGNSEAELKGWREANEVRLDPQTGEQIVTFKVQLPQGKDTSEIRFKAYAFNEDRVKSRTARYEWPAEQKAKLPKAQPDVHRRAYIISVGVNSSLITRWNLKYAANDAYQFQKVVPEKLRQTGKYETVPIELVSDLKTGRPIENAAKQNIKTVFELLAGKDVPLEVKQRIPNFQQIEKATPDDLVLITFSSHGYSDSNGNFYLLPSDIAQTTAKQKLPDLSSMISSEELSLWLREVDASEMAIVIDACHAAAAVEGLEFKPGPLGSRGLGQLAYDKRIEILTATQASNFALEVGGKINQGLLSYALVKEGLSDGLADSDSDSERDEKILLKEWLKYGEGRVSSLYKDVADGKIKGVRWKGFDDPGGERSKKSNSLQRATLFDFSSRSDEVVLSLVTKIRKK
jgi:WD40 repeat protein